ncbi:gas vesicle protein GvpN [Paenibacillus silvisoli]|uniref:gas vesicle protein GvpN n=1 Tax=Paenibacillus silvisoli TaxID=3110539 RepID=UPI0028039884|nr:gas vesicle protein GvpN [Paenibacillus silvisoli]
MGENQFQLANDLVISPYFEAVAARALQYLKAGYPVHFTGPAGVGKTSYALYIARQLNRPITLIHGNHEMVNDDLLGAAVGYSHRKTVDNYIRTVYKKEEEVRVLRQNGLLLEAVRKGYTLIYDEFTRSRPEMNNLFLSILEEKVLPVYGRTEKVSYMPVHPDFSMLFTSNPTEYEGVYQTQDALLDRLITIPIDYCSVEEDAMIVSGKTGISPEDAAVVVRLVSAVREASKSGGKYGPGLRASIMIATIANLHHIPLRLYDEAFKCLCIDILTYPVSRKLNENETLNAKRIVEDAIRHASDGETAT